jgi:hypothetical protein
MGWGSTVFRTDNAPYTIETSAGAPAYTLGTSTSNVYNAATLLNT